MVQPPDNTQSQEFWCSVTLHGVFNKNIYSSNFSTSIEPSGKKKRYINLFLQIVYIYVFWNFLKNNHTLTSKSFGLILQNLNFIWVIWTIESYLGLWGKRVNFGITIAEIQRKVWERRRKRGERENVEFR